MRDATRLSVSAGLVLLAMAGCAVPAEAKRVAPVMDNRAHALARTLPNPGNHAHIISEATLRARLAGVEVRPSSAQPGWLTISTWREPEVQLDDAGFKLVMFWNGLDDDKWPATRIAEVLAAEICGRIPNGAMDGLLDRLYRARSLVPERDLGGNAGSTFKKRLTASLGACKVELLAEGARWHNLAITVRR